MLKLFAVLKEFNCKKSKDMQFCCIIFVQRRFTAQVLYHVLKVSYFQTKMHENLCHCAN